MADNDRQDPWLGAPRKPDEQPRQESKPAERGAKGQEAWTHDVLERLAFASLHEQRRTRRWSIFFKLLFFSYLVLLLILYWPDNIRDEAFKGAHTAMVEIRGVIADGEEASADNIIAGLRRAFENEDSRAVILRINSPGGSPVQAGYVNDEITRLREEYPDKPVYAVVTDICASGGYYIAAAADRIYANKASIVGSIGVLMNGFGFVDALDKLGVERRLFTAGENKGFLDPFSPINESEVEHARRMLNHVHRQFIDVVRKGRGDRLKADSPEIFSGLTWIGEEGIELGLVDALGNSRTVAREVVGEERIVDYTHQRPYFERLVERFGVVLADTFMTTFQDKAYHAELR